MQSRSWKMILETGTDSGKSGRSVISKNGPVYTCDIVGFWSTPEERFAVSQYFNDAKRQKFSACHRSRWTVYESTRDRIDLSCLTFDFIGSQKLCRYLLSSEQN